MDDQSLIAGGLAISIINYRTGAMTCRAAASVLDDLDDRPARLVIVDNASGDGSADEIADWIAARGDARVQLVRSVTNTGFSGGHNQGIAAAPEAEFYLVLNSDAVLRPGFFDEILAVAEAHPKAGLIAPRLEWENGAAQVSLFRFASPASELIRGAGNRLTLRLDRSSRLPEMRTAYSTTGATVPYAYSDTGSSVLDGATSGLVAYDDIVMNPRPDPANMGAFEDAA